MPVKHLMLTPLKRNPIGHFSTLRIDPANNSTLNYDQEVVAK